jgi:Flp pilus assembly protein CpaB
MNRLASLWRDLRRAASWHRRLLAAGLAAAAVAAGLTTLAPPPPRTVEVLVAAHDLAGGGQLGAGDVRLAAFLPPTVPSGALRRTGAAVGRVLAAPLRAGQPLTDLALVGDSLVAGYGRGVVGAPVRIADAGAVSLLHVGDTVDVLAAAPDGGQAATVVAAAAPVVAVPAVDADGGPLGSGALLVLAVSPQVAAELATAAVSSQLSLVFHH